MAAPPPTLHPHFGALNQRKHIDIIDALRAIAALSVFWYHLSGFKAWTIPGLHESGRYGWLGVQVFFAISGFIIPYSLSQVDYRPRSFGRFLAKRVVRLDPPYLATIVMIVAYSYLASRTPLHQGEPFHIPVRRVLAHLFYLNTFLGLPWLADVFWTLAIEFQYYIAVGLLYPLLSIRGWYISVLLVTAAAVGAVAFPLSDFLPHHAPSFLFGICAFRFKGLNVPRWEFVTGVCATFATTAVLIGSPQALAGLATCAALVSGWSSTPLLTWFGRMSYSLYLTHATIADIVVNQGLKMLGGGYSREVIVLSSAAGAALICAFVMLRLVEEPAKAAAAAITYKSRDR